MEWMRLIIDSLNVIGSSIFRTICATTNDDCREAQINDLLLILGYARKHPLENRPLS